MLFNINTFFCWGWPHPSEGSRLGLAVLPNLLSSRLFLSSATDGLVELGHGRLLVVRHGQCPGCLRFMQSARAALPNALPQQTVFKPVIVNQTTLQESHAFAIVGIACLAQCSEDEVSAEPNP